MASLAILLSGAMLSCSDKDDYSPGEPETGAQVYFPGNAQTQYTLTDDATTFSVPIYRADDSETITVALDITPAEDNTLNDAITYPSSVTFNAGEKTAYIVFTYNLEEMMDDEGNYIYDEGQNFLIEIEESQTTKYGANYLDITAIYPSPWTSLGKGKYIDEYDWVNEDGDTTEVEFFQNDLDKNLFRVTNPYEWDTESDRAEYFEFYLLPPGSSYGEIEIPEDFGTTIVAYSDFAIEYIADYESDLYLVFPGRFQDYSDPSDWVYNYVVDFQENGLPGEIHLSPFYYMFGVGGWDRTTAEEVQMIFPGYEKLDTTVEVTYNGMLSKTDNSLEAVAYVELGADVTEAKVALVAGNLTSDQLAGIQDGSIESQTITATGTVNLPFDSDNEEGKYTIVAVAYYEDQMRNYATDSFTYTPATSETWAYVTTGTYTFLSEVWGEDDDDVVEDVLDLYESEATPGKFKIEGWMGDEYPLIFKVADDGSISFNEQETGVETQYGMIYAWDMNNYFEETDYPSYLEDGIYNFAMVYYVNDGYFGYGYETFVPSTEQAAPAKALAAKTYNVKKTVSKAAKMLKKAKTRHSGKLSFSNLISK